MNQLKEGENNAFCQGSCCDGCVLGMDCSCIEALWRALRGDAASIDDGSYLLTGEWGPMQTKRKEFEYGQDRIQGSPCWLYDRKNEDLGVPLFLMARRLPDKLQAAGQGFEYGGGCNLIFLSVCGKMVCATCRCRMDRRPYAAVFQKYAFGVIYMKDAVVISYGCSLCHRRGWQLALQQVRTMSWTSK